MSAKKAHPSVVGVNLKRRLNVDRPFQAAITVSVTTAASGKYIRRSATMSRIGTTLELGANVRKNHAPKNPSGGAFTNAHPVAATRQTASTTPTAFQDLGRGETCQP